ncbi:Hsp70 family protein [Leifsonia sp. NCR5]|uniref:Hsp70 family protein n=1 Tax=Leifsonia sp. NCR5 TaxID=1978342 RepID=UPI000A19379E|nr:Hsp70 family protein [Leifsonia sp. NCR5]
MTTPIGIDLGTTFSVVASVTDDGSLRIIDNAEGSALTPSVVHFESAGSVVVGAEAKRTAPVDPDRVVAGIKRQMGTDFALEFDGESYRPEAISAIVLRALAEGAARALGCPPGDLAAVVTVPAYFGTAEREATAAAARIAGLETLDLVAEPVAAALSYGVTSEDRGSVLVYDLGGGTFDATVIRLTDQGPRVVAVDGASRLGGLDFDERLGALLLERYASMTDDEAALDDEEFALRVYADAEELKKKLSRAESAALPISRGGKSARIAVTRAEFEAATASLVHETLRVVDRVISAATALGAPAPSQVLLTGGSTRMPAITLALQDYLRVPVRLSDPDTAVAKGAAIHARALSGTGAEPAAARLLSSPAAARLLASRPVRSVVPRAIGVKIHDSHDPSGKGIIVEHIIPANAPLPVREVTTTFATVVDGQNRIRIELMEQAGSVAGSDLAFNRRILDGELTGLPADLPSGSPIDVSVSIGTDGRIECVARERGSGRELVLESYMEGVADAHEAAELRRVVSGLLVKG